MSLYEHDQDVMAPAPGVRQMAARFASSCTCGQPIRTGDDIRYVPGMAATHEACGDPTERSSRRASTGRSRGRRPMMSYRCTHEDYPCCGCGQDAGR